MARELLLTGAYQYTEDQLARLKKAGWNIEFLQNEMERTNIPVDGFEAVVCNNLFMYNKIEDFTSLKIVQATSAGYDRMPVLYMREHGIRCYNAKGVYSIPMAEWAVMNILQLSKSAPRFIKNQVNHIWEKERSIIELTDKCVAIVGFGDIGKEIAKRIKSFGVNVIAVNRSMVKSPFVDKWLALSCLDQALKIADIVIVSIALTNDTYAMFGKAQFQTMKNGSIFINLSRGDILCEDALIDALENEKFMGVALDVFSNEPLNTESVLWDYDKVIITPHNSYMSDMVHSRMFELICDNLNRG